MGINYGDCTRPEPTKPEQLDAQQPRNLLFYVKQYMKESAGIKHLTNEAWHSYQIMGNAVKREVDDHANSYES